MRIDRFDLIAYGSFTEKSLDLSQGDAGLHLIYGNNEAGKSTSLRALIALLFGIAPRTDDNYLHPNPQLRLGGKLRLANGNELEFIRRKGSKGTLLEKGTNNNLDDSILAPYLSGGIDENLFTKLFGIDHARLISGGQELLSQSGDLGQALFSAAVGTSNLRSILSDLQTEAEELYKPRASTKTVNLAVSKFRESRKQVKEASLPVTEWKRLQKDLSECLLAIGNIEAEIDKKNREKSRLDRLNRVKGALAERYAVMTRLEKMAEVLLLQKDFNEQLKITGESLQNGTEAKERAEAKQTRLKKDSEQLNVRHELLENEDTILLIHKELGAVETAISDRPQQDGKRRLLRNEAEQLLKSVDPTASLADIDKLRPLINNRKWIHGLAQKHSLLEQKRKETEFNLQNVKDEQEVAQKGLKVLAVSKLDLQTLKSVVASARKAGDVEQQVATLQKRAQEKHSGCEIELSRLGRFSGTIAELAKLSMPLTETLDLYEKQFDELDETIKTDTRRKIELIEEKRQAELSLGTFSSREVPTIAELEDARSKRDRGWSLIRKKYIEKIEIDEDSKENDRISDLPLVYEQKVQVADHVSDQLRLAADQVIKRADLETNIENLQSRITDFLEDIAKTEKKKEICQKQWQTLWVPSTTIPGTPREMKQWLLKVENLLGNYQEANSISRDATQIAAKCVGFKKSVSHQISQFDGSVDLQGQTLEAMMHICEQRIELEDKLLQQKRNLLHSLNNTEIRLKRAEEDLKAIAKDQSIWAKEWHQAIEGLGLPSEAHPEQAIEVLEQLVAFLNQFDKSEELRKRIYGIDQVVEKFKKKVQAFSKKIGYHTEGQETTTIAALLNRDLNKTREARASLAKIEMQAKDTQEEIVGIDITIRTAKEHIATLMKQAGVEKEEELEKAGEKSLKKRGFQQRLETLDIELNRNGDGLSIEELEQEAKDSDIDTLEGELEKVTFELRLLQQTRDELRDKRQTMQNEINSKDGSAIAAKASEEAEQYLADMVSGVEQYLRLQIASLLLQQKIEDYRKKNQAPVLAKAAQIFSKITLGSYASLRDELDKNNRPILLGVRPNNIEVAIDGMSEGTRDQLYLSLRLATLEQHLQNTEPIPFIVDDILIGFDDDRTTACLEILAELAGSTQVLLFTHHRRVIELASRLEAKAGIFSHELS